MGTKRKLAALPAPLSLVVLLCADVLLPDGNPVRVHRKVQRMSHG